MNSINSSSVEKVKIVVVGDSGVGKTSLVHMIVHQEVLKKSNWTIGCSVDVKLHEFKDGTHQHKTYFIEFFDIGGYLWHKASAKMFYSGVDGIILVHDLTNRKSEDNLKQWLQDVQDQNESIQIFSTDYDKIASSPRKYTSSSATGGGASGFMSSSGSSSSIPVLIVGTKLDHAQMVRNYSSLRSSSSIALELRADEINLDCLQFKYLAPGTSNSIKLAKFFDKVIENKQIQTNKEVVFGDKNSYFMQSERPKFYDSKLNTSFQSKLK